MNSIGPHSNHKRLEKNLWAAKSLCFNRNHLAPTLDYNTSKYLHIWTLDYFPEFWTIFQFDGGREHISFLLNDIHKVVNKITTIRSTCKIKAYILQTIMPFAFKGTGLLAPDVEFLTIVYKVKSKNEINALVCNSARTDGSA